MWELANTFLNDYGLASLLTVLAGYLIGSVNFSIIFTRAFINKDIRSFGSGNAGATNVLRSVGKIPAILTFVCDFSKAALSVFIGSLLFRYLSIPNEQIVSSVDLMARYGACVGGLSCFLGHIYPLYFKFKGGKGVVTAAAMMLLVDWRVFLIEVIICIPLLLITKIVSLCSVLAAALYPVVTFLVTYLIDYKGYYLNGGNIDYTINYVVVFTAVAAFVGIILIVKHRSNIGRLLKGTEKPIKSKD